MYTRELSYRQLPSQYLKYFNHFTELDVRYRVHKSPPLIPALIKIYPEQKSFLPIL